jgi:hypothetical protein
MTHQNRQQICAALAGKTEIGQKTTAVDPEAANSVQKPQLKSSCKI